jgi:hypothetical protein
MYKQRYERKEINDGFGYCISPTTVVLLTSLIIIPKGNEVGRKRL